ncbi:hypothetical protein [Sphingobium sp. CAP-1]|uniref:hypothetical protein n=1 Tax=Sphingobium sp. CAP-1 TaxID=2676077 RepID=UPI0012BB260E|nr:hypothetical protein [Sphingobium sp. CAP-1]QGP78457.1 hypothetical protein GL174_05250 [Sphingobium sp. CAP-1]
MFLKPEAVKRLGIVAAKKMLRRGQAVPRDHALRFQRGDAHGLSGTGEAWRRE